MSENCLHDFVVTPMRCEGEVLILCVKCGRLKKEGNEMLQTITLVVSQTSGGEVRIDATVDPPIPFERRMTEQCERVAQHMLGSATDRFGIIARVTP